jgi:O-antigen/teichoic acid export membrane protein
MLIPQSLILSHGRHRFILFSNIAGALVILPLLYAGTLHFGLLGAAIAWPLLNLGFVAVSAPIALRHLLPGSAGRWYWSGIVLPLLGAAAAMVPLRMAIPTHLRPLPGFAAALCAGALGLLGACIATKTGRSLLTRAFFKLRKEKLA